MNELVKDLREQSKGWEQITKLAPESWHGELMAQAADEIERLEAQCSARAEWGIKLAQAEGKIERLEAVLERIGTDGAMRCLQDAVDAARAALNGEKE